MVNTSVSVKNKYSFFFSFSTVASINAVVRPIIPLARKNKKAFWIEEKWYNSNATANETCFKFVIDIFLN